MIACQIQEYSKANSLATLGTLAETSVAAPALLIQYQEKGARFHTMFFPPSLCFDQIRGRSSGFEAADVPCLTWCLQLWDLLDAVQSITLVGSVEALTQLRRLSWLPHLITDKYGTCFMISYVCHGRVVRASQSLPRAPLLTIQPTHLLLVLPSMYLNHSKLLSHYCMPQYASIDDIFHVPHGLPGF